jgi:fumarylacetoacetase
LADIVLKARDIQALEMPPLGPFNGKSLGTTLSPWIVTLEALQPFRTGRTSNQDKVFSQYMRDSDSPMFDITMQVEVVTESSAHLVGKSNVQTLHWSPGQMIAHAVSSGSSIRTGDVIATGTVSGSEKGSFGCLLESTEGGTNPIEFPDGSKRVYLEDNDVVRMTAYAGNLENGVGFGECVGRLIPAHPAASLDV